MENINKKLTVISLLIIATIAILYTKSFKDDVPSCNGYITNVYLYIILGLLIAAFNVLFIAKRKYPITTTPSGAPNTGAYNSTPP